MAHVVYSSEAMPYACGVYTCECGKRVTQHGRRAATLPRGWREWTGADGVARHLCATCAAAAADAAGADDTSRG